MRRIPLLVLAMAIGVAPADGQGPQKSQKRDEEFVRTRPVVGDTLPEVTVYTPDGKESQTASLRGHYTVLTFGCLT